ncbi:MAG: hypothetical protein HY833_01800 [Candidatus Aenigmarchaeota archaeon]|nr:hypothetical protein [Candidatus Aenigmarchaeota archaeon]
MGLFDGVNLNFLKKKADDTSVDSGPGDYSSSLGMNKPVFGPDQKMSYDEQQLPQNYPPQNYPSQGYGSAPLPPLPQPSQAHQNQFASQENMKAKIDLMMTQVDSIRLQNENLNERLVQIEKMVKQLLEMAKSRNPF